jgi:Tfp pilus assembly protein PilX
MRRPQAQPRTARWLSKRLRQEQGFTMIVALGVLTVTALLTAAVMLTVQGDAMLTRSDLNGKRAYSAAQAGLQAYLYALNNSSTISTWWQTCANDQAGQAPGQPVAVPGSTTGVSYSYTPVRTCSTSDPVGTLIDNATGTMRMKFTGYAGTPQVTRTIVASLRTLSPLDYLWYTVHETVDTSIQGTGCATFYYTGSGPPSQCYIYWVTGDKMNGPMYTQDQLLIASGGSPVLGRGPQDVIASQVPTAGTNDICAFSNCQNDPNILGTRQPNVSPTVPLPTDNSNLLTDATKHGQVYSGTTTITLNGNTANVWNCPNSSSSASCTNTPALDLTANPIIYATGSCGSQYDPTSVSYPLNNTGHYFGTCGDVYVSGSYTTPLTIAAANDVIVSNNVTTSEDSNGNPTGTATLGLVADYYVRVMHTCSANPARTIDGAILTLAHSFFVDNYNCGGSSLGQLTVHGAIAQYYRGVVGQINNSGYLKNYNYDDRLEVTLPPYLFDLQSTAWNVFRETLCTPNGSTSDSTSCSYTGP